MTTSTTARRAGRLGRLAGTALAALLLGGCGAPGTGTGRTGPPASEPPAPDRPTGSSVDSTVPTGLYVCQTTGTAESLGLPSFELRADGTYHVTVAGAPEGRWSYAEAERLVRFEGGALAGHADEGVYVPGTEPGRRGSETIFLRRAGDARSPEEAAHPACYLSQDTAPTDDASTDDASAGSSGNLADGPAPGTYSCWGHSVLEEDALVLDADGTYTADLFTSGGDQGNWSYDPSTTSASFDGPGLADYEGRMVEDGSEQQMPGPTLVLLPRGLQPVPNGLGQFWCQADYGR